MKSGDVYKDNYGIFRVFVGFEVKGTRKKMRSAPFGEYTLKHNQINLENMSASNALERIMDICGIDPDDKFKIRSVFNYASKPRRGSNYAKNN